MPDDNNDDDFLVLFDGDEEDENGELLERLEDGNFRLNLSHTGRVLLTVLPSDLANSLESEDNDGSTVRLFPPGRSDDLIGQIEYDRLMRDQLQTSHLDALKILQETSQAKELTEEQVHAWVRAVNQLRLVLGTRIGIDHDGVRFDPDQDAEKEAVWAVYEFLGALQDELVQALSESL